jgi:hypothetical protein
MIINSVTKHYDKRVVITPCEVNINTGKHTQGKLRRTGLQMTTKEAPRQRGKTRETSTGVS